MKVTLYIASSIDGFIARNNGDSDWVSEIDAEIFDNKMLEYGCIIVGNTTFKQYEGDLYPVTGVTNIIVSKNKGPNSESVFYAASVSDAIKIAEENNHSKALLVGGGKINSSFLKENAINEVIFSIHPLILGSGIQIFEGNMSEKSLELVETKSVGNKLVHITYKVIN